jgi:uncharacterized protein with gpF-like domain
MPSKDEPLFPMEHDNWCWVVEHPGEGYPCGCWVGPYNRYVASLEAKIADLELSNSLREAEDHWRLD